MKQRMRGVSGSFKIVWHQASCVTLGSFSSQQVRAAHNLLYTRPPGGISAQVSYIPSPVEETHKALYILVLQRGGEAGL